MEGKFFPSSICSPQNFPQPRRTARGSGRALTCARGSGEAVSPAGQQRQHLQRHRQPEEHGAAARPRAGPASPPPAEPPGAVRPAVLKLGEAAARGSAPRPRARRNGRARPRRRPRARGGAGGGPGPEHARGPRSAAGGAGSAAGERLCRGPAPTGTHRHPPAPSGTQRHPPGPGCAHTPAECTGKVGPAHGAVNHYSNPLHGAELHSKGTIVSDSLYDKERTWKV